MSWEFRKYKGKTNNYTLLQNVTLPFYMEEKLDEALDEAHLTMVNSSSSRRIAKNTRIGIYNTETQQEKQFIVVQDVVTRYKASTQPLYEHDISLIESTALLSNIQLPNITFSKYSQIKYIKTASDFLAIQDNVNYTYLLVKDIVVDTFNVDFTNFSGNLIGAIKGDGTLYKITINNMAKSTIFPQLNQNCVIANIDFEIGTVNCTEENIYSGLLVSYNSGTITNCIINITSVNSNNLYMATADTIFYVGNIVGYNNGTINQIYANVEAYNALWATSSKSIYYGAFVGFNNAIIQDCGFVRGNSSITILNTVITTNIYLNGFCYNNSTNNASVERCYGYNVLPRYTISANSITRPNINYDIFIASSDINDVINCYYSSTSTATSQTGAKRSNKQLKQQDTYIGFDFTNIWEMQTLPVLQNNNLSTYLYIDILSILQRLCDICNLHFVDEPNEFSIAQHTKDILIENSYNNTSEFFFNGLNLLEALQEIGTKINAIPRLSNWNEIDFDFLNRVGTVWEEPVSGNAGQQLLQSAEEYCTNLVSYGKNVVTSEDENAGSIVFPYPNGWISTRSLPSESVRVVNDTAVLILPYKIYNIISFKIKNYDINNQNNVFDLTPYLFEKSRYDTLPATDNPTADNPYVQGLALYYTQYNNTISGLVNQPIQGFTPIAPALQNIISTYAKPSSQQTEISNLLFQITYQPVFDNVQVTHKKNADDFENEQDLLLNQTVNQVSSQNFGNYKQAKMDKLGNIGEGRKYLVNIADCPSLGDKLYSTDYLINVIKGEYYSNICQLEISFTKNFQKISEYISINSRKRPFEIPADNFITDRHIHQEQFVVFADEIPTNLLASNISSLFMDNVFTPCGVTPANAVIECNLCRINTADKNGNKLFSKYFYVPVNSYATPRSLCYSFSMQDNVSVGLSVVGVNGNEYATNSVLYTNNGLMDSYYVNYITNITTNYDNSPMDYNGVVARAFPNVFNSGVEILQYDSLIDIDRALLVEKDLREIISQTFEIQYQCADNIILGYPMTYQNPTITNTQLQSAKLYILDRELGEYERILPDDAQFVQDLDSSNMSVTDVTSSSGANIKQLTITTTSEQPCVCWFIVNADNNIVLGKRTNQLNAGENIIYAIPNLTRIDFSGEPQEQVTITYPQYLIVKYQGVTIPSGSSVIYGSSVNISLNPEYTFSNNYEVKANGSIIDISQNYVINQDTTLTIRAEIDDHESMVSLFTIPDDGLSFYYFDYIVDNKLPRTPYIHVYLGDVWGDEIASTGRFDYTTTNQNDPDTWIKLAPIPQTEIYANVWATSSTVGFMQLGAEGYADAHGLDGYVTYPVWTIIEA